MYLVISGGHPKAAPSEIRPQYLEANMCELVALRHRVQKLNYSIFFVETSGEMLGYPMSNPITSPWNGWWKIPILSPWQFPL